MILFLAPLGGSASEDAPLSAIDWLSDSVSLPEEKLAGPDVAGPNEALPIAITVAPLDQTTPDHSGIGDAGDIGLDPGLWGRSSAGDLANALNALPDATQATPTLRRFLVDLLTLRLSPPVDAVLDDQFFFGACRPAFGYGAIGASERLDRWCWYA